MVVVEASLQGIDYWFPDAVQPEPFGLSAPATDGKRLMELRIRGATGHDRYTERLAGTDLGSVLYVYGTNDTSVGRLTDREVEFLESRGSTVLAVHSSMYEDHGSMFMDNEVAAQIADALNE
jgi:hypothetical protein